MEPLEFTDDLRQVLAAGREEAARLQHEHVGTEHLLLALLRHGDSAGDNRPADRACVALDAMGVDRAGIQQVIEETVLRGRVPSAAGQIPYTARAKTALELAMAEARMMRREHVDTEHLLLGLVSEERGIAAQVLLDHGVTLEKTRAEVARLEGPDAATASDG